MNLFLLNISIGFLAFVVNKFNTQTDTRSPFEVIEEIQETLDNIEDEDTKIKASNFINNLINMAVNNPAMGYMFQFLIYITPILNLLLLIKSLSEFIKLRYK